MAEATSEIARVKDQLDRVRGERSTMEAVAENAVAMAQRLQSSLPESVTPGVVSVIAGGAGFALGVANAATSMDAGWGEAIIPAGVAATAMVAAMFTESPDKIAAEGAMYDSALSVTTYVVGKQTVRTAKGFWDKPSE